MVGGKGREREVVRRLDWRESQGNRQDTYLAFPAGGVVVGAVVGVGAREGGGRDVPEGFALLIDHGCFCGVVVAGLDEARAGSGLGEGLRRRTRRQRRRTCWWQRMWVVVGVEAV